jgi:hypothetical protein
VRGKWVLVLVCVRPRTLLRWSGETCSQVTSTDPLRATATTVLPTGRKVADRARGRGKIWSVTDTPRAGPETTGFPLPSAGPQLTGRQRALLDAFSEVDARLAKMFLGALTVLEQQSNGERFAQAAHTLRELINRLPASLGLTTPAMNERLGDRLGKPEQAWSAALAQSGCRDGNRWSGTIDPPLARALLAIGEFFEWKSEHRPRRRTEMTQTIRRLDASGRQLPERIESMVVNQWGVTREYFIGVCHYNVEPEEREFFGYLDVFEEFLINRLRPRTFADFDAVDAVIEEAERGD